MNSQLLIKKLEYKDNPAFLKGARLKEHYGYSFFFAQASKKDTNKDKGCNLKGVYTLSDSSDKLSKGSLTPVVYVCEAENESRAEKIHERVWNQNIVPFVMVVTPKNVRLYSGFEYDRNKSDEDRTLAVAKDANEILSKLSDFTSKKIDSGDIWQQQRIVTERRVDRQLLANLEKLSKVLTGDKYKLAPKDAHILIGKYIYLKYLRDRGILSDKRLSLAGVSEEQVYSRAAEKEKLYQLEAYLDGFLNGSVFPLPNSKKITTKHIKEIACTFKGGDPETGQQALFDIYDFSYIPIETLSVVYQQFLHQKGKGREKGAYYTPVHLVNFILDELETKNPLKKGMKIFDPSCGSGVFLVQSYRRMIESVVRKSSKKLKPTELRSLLVDHVFGLDADKEACQVTQLSLSLTLLDYINPPDLKTYPSFKLPDLSKKNIFYCEGGFFDGDSLWVKSVPKKGYDWIVGNPPWKNINKKKDKTLCDIRATEWIDANKKQYPVDNYQLAEAFTWKTAKLIADDGQCGLLIPALTLFKNQAKKFRSTFFSNIEVWCVVNFANLRHNLFKKADNPTAAFFFSGRNEWDKNEHYIITYAPFASEYSSQLNPKAKEIWTVFVNYSTIKEVPLREVSSGSSTAWKLAMWGTHRDKAFWNRLNANMPILEDFVKQNALHIGEGLQLRDKSSSEKIEICDGVEGELSLQMDKLKGVRGLHSFSREMFTVNRKKHVRKGQASPIKICHPPHIFVDDVRRFAIYSEDFFIVPPRQIGIAGGKPNKLKALALFLKSDLAYYLQFWSTVKMGIERDVFNLNDLKKLVMPLLSFSDDEIANLAHLHDDIASADKQIRQVEEDKRTPLFNAKIKTIKPILDALLARMNNKFYGVLGVSKKQRWLIEDMLRVRIKLNDGKIAKEAVEPASKKEITDFASIFQEELDLFLDHTGKRSVHKVKVLYTDSNAVIIVDHLKRNLKTKPEVVEVKNSKTRRELRLLQEKLTETKSNQWMYFTRCLRIYEDRRTYIFKPRQRLYWLKSQALVEADEFIDEKLR